MPTILVMDEGCGSLRAASPGPIRISVDEIRQAVPTRRRGAAPRDETAWILTAIRERLPDLELGAHLHALLPRMTSEGTLALPVWGVGRRMASAHSPPSIQFRDPHEALAAIGHEAVDHAFAREALTSIRRAMAADPFLQRIAGDSLRMRAAATDELLVDRNPEPPAVIGLLPEVFSVNDLQQSIGAALGVSAQQMESGSNFRRRIQEFVTLGVLREVPGDQDPRALAERVGRPPRLFTFDLAAWRLWLARRTLSRKELAESMPDSAPSLPMEPLAQRLAASRWDLIEHADLLSDLSIEESRQTLRALQSRDLVRRNLEAPKPHRAGAPDGESRLSRLEALVERLLAKFSERPPNRE